MLSVETFEFSMDMTKGTAIDVLKVILKKDVAGKIDTSFHIRQVYWHKSYTEEEKAKLLGSVVTRFFPKESFPLGIVQQSTT